MWFLIMCLPIISYAGIVGSISDSFLLCVIFSINLVRCTYSSDHHGYRHGPDAFLIHFSLCKVLHRHGMMWFLIMLLPIISYAGMVGSISDSFLCVQQFA
jgi:hypothetical protein